MVTLGVGASCLLQVCPGTKRELSLFATLFESADPPMTKPGSNQNNVRLFVPKLHNRKTVVQISAG